MDGLNAAESATGGRNGGFWQDRLRKGKRAPMLLREPSWLTLVRHGKHGGVLAPSGGVARPINPPDCEAMFPPAPWTGGGASGLA